MELTIWTDPNLSHPLSMATVSLHTVPVVGKQTQSRATSFEQNDQTKMALLIGMVKTALAYTENFTPL